MIIQIELLDSWNEKDPYDTFQHCSFKANFFKTKELLIRELEMVGARNVVLWTQHSPLQIGKGGWPRVDRPPEYGSGVILEFEKLIDNTGTSEKLRFPCRTFKSWEDNVRAIALALESLRRVDRYGITTGAQYGGYKALPAAPVEQQLTPELAADFIARSAGMIEMPGIIEQVLANPEFSRLVYTTAAKKLHPDKGGSVELFSKLENAWAMVKSQQQAGAAGGGA